MAKVHADKKYLDSYEVADAYSYISAGGPTLRVDLNDENYIILIEGAIPPDAVKATIDVSLREGIIRIYDSSRRWKIHAMNRDSRTTEVEILDKS